MQKYSFDKSSYYWHLKIHEAEGHIDWVFFSFAGIMVWVMVSLLFCF